MITIRVYEHIHYDRDGKPARRCSSDMPPLQSRVLFSRSMDCYQFGVGAVALHILYEARWNRKRAVEQLPPKQIFFDPAVFGFDPVHYQIEVEIENGDVITYIVGEDGWHWGLIEGEVAELFGKEIGECEYLAQMILADSTISDDIKAQFGLIDLSDVS